MSIEDLKEQLVKHAIEHGRGTLSGDFERANRAYKEVVQALRRIRSLDASLESLLPLLQHESLSVRTWVATCLLPQHTEHALEALRKASKEKGPIAFGAGVTVDEWKAGRLKPLIDQ